MLLTCSIRTSFVVKGKIQIEQRRIKMFCGTDRKYLPVLVHRFNNLDLTNLVFDVPNNYS